MFFAIEIMMGMLLFAAAVFDIKTKSVGLGLIAVIMLAGFAGAFARENFGMREALGGALTGMVIVGISVLCREQIGRGDGFLIAAMGLMLGFRECLLAVGIASVIMAFASVVVLVFRKGNRNTRLPFIPALFVGYVACKTYSFVYCFAAGLAG